MQFNHFESGVQGANRCGRKSLDDSPDPGLVESFGDDGLFIEGNRTRSVDRLPSPSLTSTGPPPSHGAAVEAFRPACANCVPAREPCFSMNRTIRASISTCSSFSIFRGSVRTDSAICRNGVGFREDESGLSHSSGAEMHQMPVVCESIFARVLAHGGNDDSVAEFHVTNL